MKLESSDVWLLGFRINDEAKGRRFAQWIDDNDGKIVIHDSLARVETDHNSPNELWERVQRFFGAQDRCVIYYIDEDGYLAEAIYEQKADEQHDANSSH